MKVLIYVNTSKEVGEVDHLKVFANEEAMEKWFEENDPRAWHSNMRYWSEQYRPPHRHAHDADRGARGHLEFARALTPRRHVHRRRCPV